MAYFTAQSTLATINHGYFVVEIFRIAWLMRKLNARKHMHTINNITVQGCLSENYLIIAQNILDMKYSRFMV